MTKVWQGILVIRGIDYTYNSPIGYCQHLTVRLGKNMLESQPWRLHCAYCNQMYDISQWPEMYDIGQEPKMYDISQEVTRWSYIIKGVTEVKDLKDDHERWQTSLSNVWHISVDKNKEKDQVYPSTRFYQTEKDQVCPSTRFYQPD